MTSTTKFTWKKDASAGDIPAYVHYAPAAEGDSKPRPIVLSFHAGGFMAGTTHMTSLVVVAALVELGFIVVLPEYRLCPQVSLRDGPVQDAADSLDWARNELPRLLKETAGVEADPTKVCAMGHSAGGGLALSLGSLPNPPIAIADFYGSKYLRDPFWSKPLPMFAAVPPLDTAFLNKIYDGPQAVISPPMFTPEGKPVLDNPRTATMICALRDGTTYSIIQPDGDLESADPATGFKAKGKAFPPTVFLHGTADIFAPFYLAERAVEELNAQGAEAVLIKADGHGHILERGMQRHDEGFDKYVMPALKFLKERV